MPKLIKAIVTEKVGHYQLDNVRYVPGDVVEVSPHLFERGCSIGHLKPVPEPVAVEETPTVEPPETPTVPETPTEEETKEEPKASAETAEEETITVEPAAGPETTKKSAKTKTKPK